MAKPRLAILGAVYPATTEGFQRFLLEANQKEAEGYQLQTLVRLDKGIASVFRFVEKPQPVREGSLLGE